MKARQWFLAVCLLAAGLAPVVGPPAPACAAETAHATLVVDKGAEALRLCVDFPDGRSSVSGIELIELAGRQHGLSYRFESFAGVGLAVCMLDGLETTGDGCLGTPYWTYWHGDGSGGWTFASQGAQASTVPDGGVDGWAWGGSSTQPAPTESACPAERSSPSPSPSPTPTPSPTPSPEPTGDPAPTPAPAPTPTEPAEEAPVPGEPAEDGSAPEEPERSSPEAPDPSPSSAEVEPSPQPSPRPTVEDRAAKTRTSRTTGNDPEPRSRRTGGRLDAVSASRERTGEGPPRAGVVGIAAALLLGGAAVLLLMRRRRDAEQ